MKWAALGCFLIVTGAAGGEQTPKFDPFAETPSPKPATTGMIAILRPGGFRDMAEAHLRAQNRKFVSNDDAEMSAYFVGSEFLISEEVCLALQTSV